MKLALWLIRRFVSAEWQESVEGDVIEEGRRRNTGAHFGGAWAVWAAAITIIKLRREERQRALNAPARWPVSPSAWWQDARLAVRSLIAAPGFTLIALVVLTLGIGATTAIYSVVDAVVLRPMPFDEADRLVVVGEMDTTRPGPVFAGSTTAPTFADWKRQQTVFQHIGAAVASNSFVIRREGRPEQLVTQKVTAGFFDTLRVAPRVGRGFSEENEIAGRDRVAVISDGLWRRRFGADPNILGRTLTFDAGTWEIIGVMPPEFSYPVAALKPTELFVPFAPFEANDLSRKGGRNYFLRVIGRLKDGVSVEQAGAEMDQITRQLAIAYPAWFKNQVAVVQPLHAATVANVRQWMLMMLGAVAFVLLIACANVANLMLVRATARSRETAIRAALGASRWQIARALLIESVVLSVAGTLCAVLLATWGAAALKSAMPTVVPRMAAIGVDLRVLAAAAIASLVTGLVFGLAPALQLSRPSLSGVIGEGGRSAMAGPDRQRVRSALMVAEIALAVVLLVGAGLFVSSFQRLTSIDLGLDYHNVLTIGVNPRLDLRNPKAFDEAQARTPALVAAVLQRVRAIHGVEAAAMVQGGMPLSGSSRTDTVTVDGKKFEREVDQAEIRSVSPEYAAVVHPSLRRGRYLNASDTAGAPLVVVLSEEAVRRFFGRRDPLGAIVEIDEALREVVGVVADARVRGPEVPIRPEAYEPFAQTKNIGVTLAIRTSVNPLEISSAVRDAVQAELPDVALLDPVTMESGLTRMQAQRRFNMMLIGLFGVLAVIIAAVGVYGVMAYIVAQQRREIGLRMALGAQRHGMVRMVLARAMTFMGAGAALGFIAAWWLADSVNAFLFEVRPHDPMVYAGVAAVLVASCLTAALVPAYRASQIDPMVALRNE